jgi:type IV secretory pathway TraG/TraD family ATPase VirD4
MSKQSATISINQLIPPSLQPLIFSQSSLVILLIVGAMIALHYFDGNKKRVLARARFGGRRERTAARKLACKQIEARKLSEAALYIGSPKDSQITEADGKKVICLPEDPNTVYVPFASEHILIMGRPGSGKTFSANDPLVRSALDQGDTVFYYDFKGHEDPAPSSKLVGYATERCYKVSIFAPSAAETCVCNLLDFLSGPGDTEEAYQLASVMNQNLKLDDSSSSNSGFFSQAGNLLIQAILILAKGSRFPDIAMCHKILALPDLVKRLSVANLDEYTKVVFDNYLSSAGSPETASSIATTASLLFTRFMTPYTLAAFCGKSTLPLDVDGRHFVVFRMNPKIRNLVGPLMASTIHLMVNRNIFRSRRTRLVFSGDEISSIDLIMLHDWLNLLRSSGFIGILGAQSFGYFEQTYGKDRLDAIIGGCTTQLVFQLNDQRTAEYYIKQLGDQDVSYKLKSRSRGKDGSNNSSSEHLQTRPLLEIQEIQQFPKGKCILLNPGYGNLKKEIRIPMIQQINIPEHDKVAMEKSVASWSKIRAKLAKESTARQLTNAELAMREMEAKLMLPLPEERQQVNNLLQELATSY